MSFSNTKQDSITQQHKPVIKKFDETKRNKKDDYIVDKIESVDEDGVVTTCGIGSWRPKWLQRFSSPLFFMLNMGLVGIIQGMTASLFFSSISTFEKRYAFDSKISGIILISDNFAEMLVSCFHCFEFIL